MFFDNASSAFRHGNAWLQAALSGTVHRRDGATSQSTVNCRCNILK